jgi:hypothetical protein
MSTSDLYIINKKSVRHIAEFSNGYGSAPPVWERLYDQYIHKPTDPPRHGMHKWNDSWKLYRDARLTAAERCCLMMTFDWAYLPLDMLEQAAWYCDEVGVLTEEEGRVNHWRAIGKTLMDASQKKWGQHARGVGLSCTSVCDLWIDCEPEDIAEKSWAIFENGEFVLE